MVASAIHDHSKRVRSYEMLADVVKDFAARKAVA
jgi:hypothetical protein